MGVIMKNLAYVLALTLAAVSTTAKADGIRLGTPEAGGNGCPAGTVGASVSPDETSLSILFDQFMAEAGGDSGKTMDRKSCNIAIPVHVPAGLSVSIIAVDYRGFNSLPAGATARMSAEYFFAGSQGPRFAENFRGPLSEDFLFNNTMAAVAWSPCGADTILRVNASTLVQTRRYSDTAISVVDSADVNAGMIYHLRTRSCR